MCLIPSPYCQARVDLNVEIEEILNDMKDELHKRMHRALDKATAKLSKDEGNERSGIRASNTAQSKGRDEQYRMPWI